MDRPTPLRRSAQGLALAFALALACVLPAASASAADDPSIQGETRQGIQAAMTSFIASHDAGDHTLLHYDPVTGKLLRLKLVELHDGIVRKGHFYVSCADFQDEGGGVVDIDFLVVPSGDDFRVNQAIVHKADGEKRTYHVEQRWPGIF
jgi:hypothetical protein